MTEYLITFETKEGEIVTEVIFADTLRDAKDYVKMYYGVKKFL